MAEKIEVEGKLINLPLARIKTIMKSSPEMNHAGQESILMVAKATELFVEYLAKEAHKKEGKKQEVSYKSLAKVVEEEDCLQFLADIVPAKVLAKDYLASLKKTQDKKTQDKKTPDKKTQGKKTPEKKTPEKKAETIEID